MSNTTFDHPPTGLTSRGRPRHIGLDVTRAVALIGVVVMNYHGMINFRGPAVRSDGLIERIFDISTGVLSTRFAATFVVVAGIAVTFLTHHTKSDNPQFSLNNDRTRLVRRGLILLATGYFLNEVWPGTIIFYYGAYFLCAAVFFRWRTSLLSATAALVAAGGVGIAIWRRLRFQNGDSTTWMNPSDLDSLGNFLLRVFIGYTHPILPWLAFFILGMIVGRWWNLIVARYRIVIAVSMLIVLASYLLATMARLFSWRDNAVVYAVTSLRPDERGLLYVSSTAGIAIIAILVINQVAETFRHVSVITHLQRAGQMTLTLYLMHVFYFYLVVDWSGLVTGTGLTTALLLSGSFWLGAISWASWWHHRLGQGPAERLYRWLGG